MAIKSNLKVLIARKSQDEGRRVTYRQISEATGISTNSITKIATNQFEMIGRSTMERLCAYFQVGLGELLEYVPDEGSQDG